MAKKTPVKKATTPKPVKKAPKEAPPVKKVLNNTNSDEAKSKIKDIEFWGNGDSFKLISKASSMNEGWMKSTKAMEIKGVGCVVQVTTQQSNNVAEALTFVPDVEIIEDLDKDKNLIGRRLSGIKRDDLYQKIFVALCSNSQSSNDVEILVNQAQCLTVEALKGMNKEQF